MWTARTEKKEPEKSPPRARDVRDARRRACGRYPVLLALALLAAASPARAQEYFGRAGVALKTGAAAGPMGVQLAWNFSPHYQLCAGGGGTSDILTLLDRDPEGSSFRRTDSYFLLGKYYRKHVFFETGYALKVVKTEAIESEQARVRTTLVPAIPLHVGYEFGHRRGFYFATSMGWFFALRGRDAGDLPKVDPDRWTHLLSAGAGPTVGLSVGYYLY